MKRLFPLLLIWLISAGAFAQKAEWQVNLYDFFDNTEFGFSKYQMPQTMSGVHVAPEIGLGWDSVHHVRVGADLLHEFGSDKVVDYSNPIAYYAFEYKPFRFYMGAFPRKMAVDRYPRIFFQDSITFYRPTITGLFWEFSKKNSYANVWLDWTSRQTTKRHEAFIMGWSGKLASGIFYGQHFGYMYHYAGVIHPTEPEALHDNGMMLTSLGVDLAEKADFEKLELNAGYAVGLERARADNDGWHKQKGFLSEARVEYRGLGIFNTFYAGHGQMYYHNQYVSATGNLLYWGDPIYQAKSYDRLDGYINFLHTDVVKVRFTYSLHFAEHTMYHEQGLSVNYTLGNIKKTPEKKYRYLWAGWFR
ncbi:hypothetical protein [Parabacteroides sp. FAFU027]|uniref:hypothetical protein n=1 Tax=Parabacteroides sp. FAFU027 TaxID=2922715 RepID=UPI001FB00345|nr:hypothetical protein [Parabacteroides sp. FAFU027]